MTNQENKLIWDDCVALWRQSADAEKIELNIAKLAPAFNAFKSKISDFEKSSIQRDITQIKRLTSNFEKTSIEKDVQRIRNSVRRFLDFLKK